MIYCVHCASPHFRQEDKWKSSVYFNCHYPFGFDLGKFTSAYCTSYPKADMSAVASTPPTVGFRRLLQTLTGSKQL